MILHGRNLIIKAGGVAIAAAKSCDISVHCEEIETSTPQTGIWRTAIIGRKSWTVSTNQLVTSIVRPLSMVGTTVTLDVQISEVAGRTFQGFVDNVTVSSGTYTGAMQLVNGIYWDKTRKKFLLRIVPSEHIEQYFAAWDVPANSAAYTSPSDHDIFSYNGNIYTWLNNDLAIEKMSGNANVVTWRVTGTIGNLAQGSFQFNGNGALTTASLPST